MNEHTALDTAEKGLEMIIDEYGWRNENSRLVFLWRYSLGGAIVAQLATKFEKEVSCWKNLLNGSRLLEWYSITRLPPGPISLGWLSLCKKFSHQN
jgi:hypothetical protein